MLTLGYDSPKAKLSDDQLERKRLALDIVELIRSTPPEISARIGIFGRWGTGKSTIMAMIASLLEERGYVLVRINPSISYEFPEMIASFADNLVSSFISRGLYVEPWFRSYPRRFRRFLSSKNTSQIVDGLGELHKGAKLVNAGLGTLSAWLSPDSDQVRKLRAALPESRVLVLIDDLDRCPPKLLPRLLLSLKEVLDIERFTFLLAFDDEIVADGITSENSAWGEGRSFLEKILDFRFLLPQIDAAGKSRLLRSEISSRASFIPINSFEEIEDLLPSNPRRLKALVRSIIGLRATVERHNDGEFAWTDVWLVELLRQESDLLVEELNDAESFNEVIGMSYRLFNQSSQTGMQVAQRADPTEALLERLHLTGEPVVAVKRILEAMRARASNGLSYVISFATRAPAITWKEFDECIDAWTLAPTPEALERWLKRHADARQDSFARVADDFCQALSNRQSEILEKALRKNVQADIDADYDTLVPLLQCTADYFRSPSCATADRLLIFYQKAQYWVGVRRPGKETELRAAELATLVECAKKLSDAEKIEFAEKLSPWFATWDDFAGMDRVAVSKHLQRSIVMQLLPTCYEYLIAFLKKNGALKRLRERSVHACFKGLLFSPLYLPWPADLRSTILGALDGTFPEVNGYDFADSMMTLWTDGLGYQSDLSREGVINLLLDQELVSKIWQVLRRIDQLERGHFLSLARREKLIENGANESSLPLDDKLTAHVEAFAQHRDSFLRAL